MNHQHLSSHCINHGVFRAESQFFHNFFSKQMRLEKIAISQKLFLMKEPINWAFKCNNVEVFKMTP